MHRCHVPRCSGHDDRDDAILHGQEAIFGAITALTRLIIREGTEMGIALQNLQDADIALKDTVATFLADVAGRLDGHDDPAIQQVADDINAEIAALKANDPGPADTGTADAGDTAPAADGTEAPSAGDDGSAAPPADGTDTDAAGDETAPADDTASADGSEDTADAA